MYIDRLNKLHKAAILKILNQCAKGRVKSSQLREKCYTIYGHRDTTEFVHYLKQWTYPVSSEINDFEILKIYEIEPTQRDQELYRAYMANLFPEYAKDLQEFLNKNHSKIEKEEDDREI